MSSANDFKQAKANGRVERIREEAKAKAEAERKRKQPREKGGFNYDLYEVNTANELAQYCELLRVDPGACPIPPKFDQAHIRRCLWTTIGTAQTR